jgi:hypothetical protein
VVVAAAGVATLGVVAEAAEAVEVVVLAPAAEAAELASALEVAAGVPDAAWVGGGSTE